MRRIIAVIGMAGLVLGASARAHGASAGSVIELQGAWLIDGYTFEPGDRSPRGTIAYDGEANRFTGTYVGLKLPADRPELHVWLYDTRARQEQHIGKGDYKPNTIGKAKGSFSIGLPAASKGGKFGRYEIVAFSAEASGTKPTQPSGSAIQASQKPAFYLYAPLSGSTLPGIYCGHGQDFSYTSNQDHVCYD